MGTEKRKTTDRRVGRTHGALRDALIALIPERGWDAMGVQDICDRANVGRSTFYAHFASKEELLISSFAALRATLRAQEGPSGEPDALTFGFVLGLIAHAHENQRLFRAVIGKRSSLLVQRRFRQLLIELVEEDLTAACVPARRRGPATHYIAGALFELLTWWVDSRSALAPRDLDAIFREWTAPVLGVLRGTG